MSEMWFVACVRDERHFTAIGPMWSHEQAEKEAMIEDGFRREGGCANAHLITRTPPGPTVDLLMPSFAYPLMTGEEWERSTGYNVRHNGNRKVLLHAGQGGVILASESSGAESSEDSWHDFTHA